MPTTTPIISQSPSPSYRLTNDTNFGFSVSWEVLTACGAIVFALIGLAIKCYVQHERMRSDVIDVRSDVSTVKTDVTEMRAEIKSDGMDMRKENKEDFKDLKTAINRLEINMSLFSSLVGRLEKDLEQVKEYIQATDVKLQENKSKNADLESKYQSIVEDLRNIHSLLQKVEQHDKAIEDMIRHIDGLRDCEL